MKKILASIAIILLYVIFLMPSHAAAAACNATTTGNWSTGSNWTGCSGVGGIPASTDTVTITAGITISLDSAATVAGTTVDGTLDTTSANHYAFTTGTLDLETGSNFKANASTITFTGTSGTIVTTNGGSFAANTSTAIFNGNGDITLGAGTGTASFNSVTLSPTLTASHTYTLGTGISIAGSFTISPTAASAATLSVVMSKAISPFSMVLAATGSATDNFSTSASSYALNLMSMSLGAGSTFNANASTITLSRTTGPLFALNSGGTFTAGTSSVIMNGDATLALTSGSVAPTFYNLTLSPTITAARTYTFGPSAVNISHNFTINPTAASALALTVNLGATTTVTGTALIQGSGSASGILNAYQGATTYTFTTGATTIGANGFFNPTPPSCSATTSGNWSTGANWTNCNGSGGIPASTDTVLINTGVTIAVDTNPTVTSLTVNGTLTANVSTITLTGTSGTLFTLTSGGTFTAGTSTVVANPNAAVTVTAGSPTFYNLTLSPTITAARTYTLNGSAINVANNFVVNPTAASSLGLTVSLGAALTVTGNTVIERTTSATSTVDTTSANHYAFTTGTLDLETGGSFFANASTLTFTGSSGTIVTTNGGTFAANGSSSIFNGNGDVTIAAGTGTASFNSVTLSPTLTASHAYTLGTGLNIAGSFTISPTAASALTLSVLMSKDLSPFSMALAASGSATDNFSTTGSNYALNVQSMSIGAGSTFNANASTVTLSRTSGPLFTLNSGSTFTAGTSTFVINSDATLALTAGSVAPTFYNLTLAPTITAARTYTFGSGALTIANNFTINPTAASALALTVNLGAATTVTGTTLIEGTTSGTSTLDTVSSSNFALTSGAVDIETAGTLNAENSHVTVAGNWTNNGVFTAGNSTVILNSSTTATVLGPTTFYNFSITPAAAKEVDFSTNPSDIITVTNIFSARGSSGNILKLHSMSAGTQWHFNPTNTATADWVDVKDGGLQPGAVNVSVADYTNSGNNDSGWTVVTSVPAGTVYYIDPAGSDSNNGTSAATPWQTLSKVNATSFSPGDQILFKKGGTWTGQLTPISSGTSANPLIFSSYGTGAKPVISGLTTLSSWTAVGGGVYESSCGSCGSTVNLLTMNGVEKGIGRYPNADAANGGYLTYQSHTSSSITDSNLSGTPDWTGAQVVLRLAHWILDADTITSDSSHTLSFTPSSSYTPTDGWGYFIQNSPSTLDEVGEWYYDPNAKNVEVYFGTNDPNAYSIAVAGTTGTLATINTNYVTIDGINFQGSVTDALSIKNNSNTTVQNSDISLSGNNAIDLSNTSYFTLQNSTINNTNNNGVTFGGPTLHTSIKNNTINNTGMIAGMGASGDGQYVAINNHTSINNYSDIEQNEIDNTGYIPLYFAGDQNVINENYINGFDSVKDDGGGIYYYNGGVSPVLHTSNIVTNNIIVNGLGAKNGINGVSQAYGMYFDEQSDHITATGNTVANMANDGMQLNVTNNITLSNNTFYNNADAGIMIGSFGSSSASLIRNNNITNNNFIMTDASQLAIRTWHAANGDTVDSFGTFDNNYFSHPSSSSIIFSARPVGFDNTAGFNTLAQWQTNFNQDLDSHEVITDPTTTFQFLQNPTTAPATTALSGNYTDVRGNAFASSITLQPYASAVLTAASSSAPTTPIVSGGGGGGGGGVTGGFSLPVAPISTTASIPVDCTTSTAFSASTGIVCSNYVKASTTPVMTTTVPSSFTLNLHLGVTNAEVKSLQQYLNAHGFSVAKSGAGSVGKETTYFGPATKAAVIKFQKTQRLSADGVVGPMTRAFLSKN